MAVNEALSAYSTTASNNTPAGTDTVGPDLDDQLRDIKKNARVAAEHFLSSTEDFRGRIKADASATPVTTLNYHTGNNADVKLLAIDESAGNSFPYCGTSLMTSLGASFVTQGTTGSARSVIGMASGGTLTAGTTAGNVTQLITGSATSIAALPAVSGEFLLLVGAQEATTAQVSSGSATGVYVPPGKIINSPYAVKARVTFAGLGGASNTASIRSSFGITSFVWNASGKYTVNFSTPFANNSYSFCGMATDMTNAKPLIVGPSVSATPTTTAFQMTMMNDGGTLTDPAWGSLVFYGDQ